MIPHEGRCIVLSVCNPPRIKLPVGSLFSRDWCHPIKNVFSLQVQTTIFCSILNKFSVTEFFLSRQIGSKDNRWRTQHWAHCCEDLGKRFHSPTPYIFLGLTDYIPRGKNGSSFTYYLRPTFSSTHLYQFSYVCPLMCSPS